LLAVAFAACRSLLPFLAGSWGKGMSGSPAIMMSIAGNATSDYSSKHVREIEWRWHQTRL
jgi:hypothetical protein